MSTSLKAGDNPVADALAREHVKALVATGMAYEFSAETVATRAFLDGFAAGQKFSKSEPVEAILPGLDMPPPVKKSKKRNPLFDAIAIACGLNAEEITKSAASVIGKALAEIREVSPGSDLKPEEIHARAREYKRQHPQWELTPTSLAKYWAGLGKLTGHNPYAASINA